MVKLSVIVAAFNAQRCIAQTLFSLLSQTIDEIEIIVIDDASLDNTKDIVQEVSLKDNRIKLYSLPRNVGVYAARSFGVSKASGKYIGFLDADDFAMPNMYRKLYDTAIDNSSDIVICGSDRVDENQKVIGPKVKFGSNRNYTEDTFATFCKFGFGTAALWNKIYKRELILRACSNELEWRQDTNEDTLVNIIAFKHANNISVIKDTLHQYTQRNNSVTSSIKSLASYHFLLKAFYLAITNAYNDGFTQREIDLVIYLYRKQLEFPSYSIDLAEYEKKDLEEFSLDYLKLVNQWPIEFYSLTSRLHHVENTSIKQKIKKFIKKLN